MVLQLKLLNVKLSMLLVAWTAVRTYLYLPAFLSVGPVQEPKHDTMEVIGQNTDISYQYISGRTVQPRDPNYLCGTPELPRNHSRSHNRRHWNSFLDHVPLATTITTDLNVIVMGESIGAQMYFMLQNAMENINNSTPSTLLHQVKEGYPLLQYDAKVRGSGSLSYWRMTDFWYAERDDLPLPNSRVAYGGWRREHARQLLDGLGKSKLDALVFRPPTGWISPASVTPEGLQSTIDMAKEIFGVSKVIFTASFLNNNIHTQDDLNELVESNERLRAFARANPEVFVLDMDTFVDSLIQMNAYVLGLADDVETLTPLDWTRSALNVQIQAKYPHRASQVCGTKPEMYYSRKLKDFAWKCERNSFSFDGMHLCPELVSGRFSAGIACLLECAFGTNNQEAQSCEVSCNSRFMRPFTPHDVSNQLMAVNT